MEEFQLNFSEDINMDHSCVNAISTVLNEEESTLVRTLLKSVRKGIPAGKMLAVLNPKSHKCYNECLLNQCPYIYCWGFKLYCNNQDVILQHTQDSKNNCLA